MDDPITVTMDRSGWQALLIALPLTQQTYTDEGIALFHACQVITQALEKPEPSDG